MAIKIEKPEGGFSLAGLSERERRLLFAMAAVFALIALFIPLTLFQKSLDKIDSETRNYKQTLDLLAVAGPEYMENKKSMATDASHKKIDEEFMTKNPIKLTSFVAKHAEATDITVASYDEDELPFGAGGKDEGPIIVEKQLRVEIRNAQMSKLVSLMDRIEKATDPVYIKRIDVRAQRKKPGEVRAVLTVSTFVMKEKQG